MALTDFREVMGKKYLIILGFIVLSAGAAVQQEKFFFWSEKLAILKAFMKKPAEVGTLAACSSFVGEEISKYIKEHKIKCLQQCPL